MSENEAAYLSSRFSVEGDGVELVEVAFIPARGLAAGGSGTDPGTSSVGVEALAAGPEFGFAVSSLVVVF